MSIGSRRVCATLGALALGTRAILGRAMSQENVEIVRRAYREGYERRTVENLRELASDVFCFHTRPGWPGRSLYRFDEIPEFSADLDHTSPASLVPKRFAAVKDDLLVTLRQSARKRGSDAGPSPGSGTSGAGGTASR